MSISILSACGRSAEQADPYSKEGEGRVPAFASDSQTSDTSVTDEPETNSASETEASDSGEEAYDFDWPYQNVTPWSWEETDPRIEDISLSDDAIYYFEEAMGGYTIQEVESENDDEYVGWYWYLNIWENDFGPYLSIYDCEAGNPGVEGYISYMDEKNITVLIDYWYYEDMPKANWSEKDLVLELQYEFTDDGIILTNGDEKTAIIGVKEIE